MDIASSLAPRSDQINADDLIAGPQTYTIREVIKGKAEQPLDFMLVETDRAYRPGVIMRRILAAAWGTNGDAYVGRRLTLYRDPSIRFGSAVVGGIRISHVSDIAKPVTEKIQVTRGKREAFTVEPLPDVAPATPQPSPEDLAAQIVDNLADCTTDAEIREWGNRAHARNLLDVQVNGETVKSHVENALAALQQASAS